MRHAWCTGVGHDALREAASITDVWMKIKPSCLIVNHIAVRISVDDRARYRRRPRSTGARTHRPHPWSRRGSQGAVGRPRRPGVCRRRPRPGGWWSTGHSSTARRRCGRGCVRESRRRRVQRPRGIACMAGARAEVVDDAVSRGLRDAEQRGDELGEAVQGVGHLLDRGRETVPFGAEHTHLRGETRSRWSRARTGVSGTASSPSCGAGGPEGLRGRAPTGDRPGASRCRPADARRHR